MSKRGIVCEIKKEYCVFLTSDGQFVRGIPTSNVQIGVEAEFREYVPLVKKHSHIKRALIPVIAAAAVFIMLFATILNPSQTVHAYVQVNGAEALEFGLNESGEVVEIRQLNGNGIGDISSQYKGKPVEEVIENVLSSGNDESDSVSITTVYTKKADDTKKVIEQAITGVKEKFEEKEVSVFEATEKDREQANEKGMAIQKHLNQLQKKEKKLKKEKKPDVKAKPEEKKPGEKSQPANKNNGQKEKKNNGRNENKQHQNPNSKDDQHKKQPPGQVKKEMNDKDKKQEHNGKNNEKNKKEKDNHGDQGNKNNNNGKGNGYGKEKNKDKNNDED